MPLKTLTPRPLNSARDCISPMQTHALTIPDRGSAMRVYVRIRPFTDRELQMSSEMVQSTLQLGSEEGQLTILDPVKAFAPRITYVFERCFDSGAAGPDGDQEIIYTHVGRVILNNVMDGYNGCIFAYGQTGSGKTHTMLGPLLLERKKDKINKCAANMSSDDIDMPSSACHSSRSLTNAKTMLDIDIDTYGVNEMNGLIPRLARDIFIELRRKCEENNTHSFRVDAEYFEIYNEKVIDLLNNGANSTELRVRNFPAGPCVEGLTRRQVNTATNLLALIRRGAVARHTASTKLNDQSSRSHAILSVHVLQMTLGENDNTVRVTSKLNLVDLAGSERTGASGVEGIQFKEATKINLSLTTLGRVIDALADLSSGKSRIICPYRDSNLTWLLMDSLGGNSKTSMVATVSPHASHYEEMSQTLRYASRAKQIVNKAVVNEDPQLRQIKMLTMEVERLHKLLLERREHDIPVVANSEALRNRVRTLEQELADHDFTISVLRDKLIAAQEKALDQTAAVKLRHLEEENASLREDLRDFKRAKKTIARLQNEAKESAMVIERLNEQIATMEREKKSYFEKSLVILPSIASSGLEGEVKPNQIRLSGKVLQDLKILGISTDHKDYAELFMDVTCYAVDAKRISEETQRKNILMLDGHSYALREKIQQMEKKEWSVLSKVGEKLLATYYDVISNHEKELESLRLLEEQRIALFSNEEKRLKAIISKRDADIKQKTREVAHLEDHLLKKNKVTKQNIPQHESQESRVEKQQLKKKIEDLQTQVANLEKALRGEQNEGKVDDQQHIHKEQCIATKTNGHEYSTMNRPDQVDSRETSFNRGSAHCAQRDDQTKHTHNQLQKNKFERTQLPQELQIIQCAKNKDQELHERNHNVIHFHSYIDRKTDASHEQQFNGATVAAAHFHGDLASANAARASEKESLEKKLHEAIEAAEQLQADLGSANAAHASEKESLEQKLHEAIEAAEQLQADLGSANAVHASEKESLEQKLHEAIEAAEQLQADLGSANAVHASEKESLEQKLHEAIEATEQLQADLVSANAVHASEKESLEQKLHEAIEAAEQLQADLGSANAVHASEKESLEQKLNEATEATEQLQADLVSANAVHASEKESLEQKLHEAIEAAEQLQADLGSANAVHASEKESLEQKLHEATEATEQLQADLGSANAAHASEKESLEQKLHEATEATEQLQADLVSANAVHASEKDSLEQKLHEATEAAEQLQADLGSANAAHASEKESLEQKLHEATEATEQLQADLVSANAVHASEKDSLEQKLHEATEAAEQLQADLGSANAVHASEKESLEQKLHEAIEAAEQLQADLGSANAVHASEKESLEQKLHEATEATEQLQADLGSANAVHASEKESLEQKLHEATEATEQLQADLVSANAVHASEKESLEQKLHEAIEAAEQLQADLGSANAVHASEKESLEQKLNEATEATEQLQADLVSANAVHASEKESLEQKLHEAIEAAEQLQADLGSANAVHASEKESLEQKLHEAIEATEQLQADLVSANAVHASEKESLEQKLHEAIEAAEQLQADLGSANAVHASEKESLEQKLHEAIEATEQLQADLVSANAVHASEKESLEQKLHEAIEAAEQLQADLGSANAVHASEKESLEQKLNEATEATEQLQADLVSANAVHASEKESLEQKLHEAIEAAEQLQADLGSANAVHASEKESLEQKLHEATEATEQLQADLGSANAAHASEKESLEQKLHEATEATEQLQADLVSANAVHASEKDSLEQKLHEATEAAEQLQADLGSANAAHASEKESLEQKLHEATEATEQLQADLVSANAVHASEKDSLEQKLHEATEAAEQLQADLGSANAVHASEKESLEQKLHEAIEAAEQLQADLGSANAVHASEKESLEQKLHEATEATEQLQADLGSANAVHASEKESLEQKLHEATEATEQLQADLVSANAVHASEKESLEQKLHEATEATEQLQADLVSANAAHASSIEFVEAQLYRVNADFDQLKIDYSSANDLHIVEKKALQCLLDEMKKSSEVLEFSLCAFEQKMIVERDLMVEMHQYLKAAFMVEIVSLSESLKNMETMFRDVSKRLYDCNLFLHRVEEFCFLDADVHTFLLEKLSVVLDDNVFLIGFANRQSMVGTCVEYEHSVRSMILEWHENITNVVMSSFDYERTLRDDSLRLVDGLKRQIAASCSVIEQQRNDACRQYELYHETIEDLMIEAHEEFGTQCTHYHALFVNLANDQRSGLLNITNMFSVTLASHQNSLLEAFISSEDNMRMMFVNIEEENWRLLMVTFSDMKNNILTAETIFRRLSATTNAIIDSDYALVQNDESVSYPNKIALSVESMSAFEHYKQRLFEELIIYMESCYNAHRVFVVDSATEIQRKEDELTITAIQDRHNNDILSYQKKIEEMLSMINNLREDLEFQANMDNIENHGNQPQAKLGSLTRDANLETASMNFGLTAIQPRITEFMSSFWTRKSSGTSTEPKILSATRNHGGESNSAFSSRRSTQPDVYGLGAASQSPSAPRSLNQTGSPSSIKNQRGRKWKLSKGEDYDIGVSKFYND